MERRRRKPPVPVTLVSGALRVGKTRLVNRLLRHPAFAETAVILNEFGVTRLEGGAAETAGDGFVALGGGCVCCTVRGELVAALERLLRALDNGRLTFRRVIIEAEAGADPAAVVAAIVRHPYLAMRFRPDAIVALVPPDCVGEGETARLAMADLIVAPQSAFDAAVAVNPFATLATPDGVDPGQVTVAPGWAAAGPTAAGPRSRRSAIALVRPAALAPGDVAALMDDLAVELGGDVFRLLVESRTTTTRTVARAMGGVILPAEVMDEPTDRIGLELRATVRGGRAPDLEDRLDIHGGGVRIDRPDRAAVVDNPLAIAGFSARPGRR